jgi:hypothetical protein
LILALNAPKGNTVLLAILFVLSVLVANIRITLELLPAYPVQLESIKIIQERLIVRPVVLELLVAVVCLCVNHVLQDMLVMMVFAIFVVRVNTVPRELLLVVVVRVGMSLRVMDSPLAPNAPPVNMPNTTNHNVWSARRVDTARQVRPCVQIAKWANTVLPV